MAASVGVDVEPAAVLEIRRDVGVHVCLPCGCGLRVAFRERGWT
jgi:hypothetical protein